MLKIHTLTLGLYQTNTYIVHSGDSRTCAVIDPGYEPRRIQKELAALDLTCEAILLTHGHFDHVGAVRELAADWDCPVYICGEDLALPAMLTAGRLYFTNTYGEGTRLTLAGLEWTVLHTPGHTPGSVCLLCGDTLFSGDTLFADSCGRTDLGGDWAQLCRSLRRLAALDADLTVYPGHGEATNLAREKLYNPYLR